MSEKRHKSLSEKKKRAILSHLTALLKTHSEISFAYLHGSFMKESNFRDIDLAVYLKNPPASPLQYELGLEVECADAVSGYTVDVRVLDGAPLSFRYNVIKDGIILFARNDDERADFIEATLAQYFDFAPYRALYLKEALGIEV